MRLFKGFLMSKDPETGKLSPFFLKVRNEDIFASKKISLDDTFHQTSGLWYLEHEFNNTDSSIFIFRYNGTSVSVGTEVANNEKCPANGFGGKVIYKVYRNGYYEIQCMFTFSALDNRAGYQSVIVVPLPYALKGVLNISPYIMPIGTYNKTTSAITVYLGNSKIDNSVLNIGDSGSYTYKLELIHSWNMFMSTDYGSGLNPCNNNPSGTITNPYVSFTITGFVDTVMFEKV